MSTSLHAVFNVIFGNADFVIVILSVQGRKIRFFESSQKSVSEKSISVTLRSFFSTYKIFPGREWLIPLIEFKVEFFNGKMSFIAGLKKSDSILRKSTDFSHFWLPRSIFKVDILNVQAKSRKILG